MLLSRTIKGLALGCLKVPRSSKVFCTEEQEKYLHLDGSTLVALTIQTICKQNKVNQNTNVSPLLEGKRSLLKNLSVEVLGHSLAKEKPTRQSPKKLDPWPHVECGWA